MKRNEMCPILIVKNPKLTWRDLIRDKTLVCSSGARCKRPVRPYPINLAAFRETAFDALTCGIGAVASGRKSIRRGVHGGDIR